MNAPSLVLLFLIVIIIIIIVYFNMSFFINVNEDGLIIDPLINPKSKYYNDIKYMDDLFNESSEELKENIRKIEVLELRNDIEIIHEMNENIKNLNNIETNNKIVIDENQIKTDKLKELNRNLDIIIAAKHEKEEELNNTNRNMVSIIDLNQTKVEKLILLNMQMANIIDLSNSKIDEFMRRQSDTKYFNNINEELKTFYTNNGDTQPETTVGDNIINGLNKRIHMDESTIFVKMNDDNYYSPIYKVEELPAE